MGIDPRPNRQNIGLYHLPLWGSPPAHEHYSWIPYRNPRKFDLLKAAMYLKYMAGGKLIINESGNGRSDRWSATELLALCATSSAMAWSLLESGSGGASSAR